MLFFLFFHDLELFHPNKEVTHDEYELINYASHSLVRMIFPISVAIFTPLSSLGLVEGLVLSSGRCI